MCTILNLSGKKIKKINDNLERIAVALEQLVEIQRRAERPPKPDIVSIILTGETEMALQFKLVLPVAGASDVVSRKLTVNGVEQAVAGDVLEVAGFEGEQDSVVEGALVDVDDAGNESVARAFSFVLVDTIAPAQPGEVGLVVTDEV